MTTIDRDTAFQILEERDRFRSALQEIAYIARTSAGELGNPYFAEFARVTLGNIEDRCSTCGEVITDTDETRAGLCFDHFPTADDLRDLRAGV